ncbi:hypothetical protein ACET3Z_032091 [Daucus carota]
MTSPASAAAPTSWSTGLFGCSSDVPNCCLTCFCPCITFGRIAEIVDKGNTSCAAACAVHALIGYWTGYNENLRESWNSDASRVD